MAKKRSFKAKRQLTSEIKAPERKMSPELKIAGFIILILGVLFAYDFVLNPDGTSDKVSSATGNIVADVKGAVDGVKKVVADEPAPELKKFGEVKILSPPKGSVQSGEFAVKVQVPSGSALCYYQIKRSRCCCKGGLLQDSWKEYVLHLLLSVRCC